MTAAYWTMPMRRFAVLFAVMVISAGCGARSAPILPGVVSEDRANTEPDFGPVEDQESSHPQIHLRGGLLESTASRDGYLYQTDADAFPEVALLSLGNSEYRAGNTEAALANWRKIVADHPNTPAWNMAILNAGRVLQDCGRHNEAVALLKLLLDDTSNYEKLGQCGPFSTGGPATTPMEAYLDLWNNDWSDACRAISVSYEALADLEQSRHYALLSRSKFAHRDWCGVAAASEWSQNDSRITELSQKINAPIELAFSVLGVALAAFLVLIAVRFVNRRKTPGARRMALAALAALVVYQLTFGPACWIADRVPRSARFVSIVYFPILRLANRSPRAASVILWYASAGAGSHSKPDFFGDQLSWWETADVDSETVDSSDSVPQSSGDPESGDVSRASM